MERFEADVVVIGGGIAGASAAAQLAATRRVVVLEAEDSAGYHTTGRSAALWLQNYGPPDAQALSRASRAFLEAPPSGFTEARLLGPRGALYLVTAEQAEEGRAMLAESQGIVEIGVEGATRMVAAVRPGFAVTALYEEAAGDLDVAAIHQGFLALLRRRGGAIVLGARATSIVRSGGAWEVVAGERAWRAPVLVNAAGAWGDVVAGMAGVAPLGLAPMRRTACIVDPGPWALTDWPAVHDLSETWYCRPEARTKLMVSPADEIPSAPMDAMPDDLDVAIGIDNMQKALAIEVRRVEHAWAGLRTFTPDRGLAIGFDRDAEGFLWCVGQGGYGIQTAPAAGMLVADLVAGTANPFAAMVDPARFR